MAFSCRSSFGDSLRQPIFICCGSHVTSAGMNQMASTAPIISQNIGSACRAIHVICLLRHALQHEQVEARPAA